MNDQATFSTIKYKHQPAEGTTQFHVQSPLKEGFCVPLKGSARLSMELVCPAASSTKYPILTQPGAFSLILKDGKLSILFSDKSRSDIIPEKNVSQSLSHSNKHYGVSIRLGFIFKQQHLSIFANGEKIMDINRSDYPILVPGKGECSELAIGPFPGILNSLAFWRENIIILRVLARNGETMIQIRTNPSFSINIRFVVVVSLIVLVIAVLLGVMLPYFRSSSPKVPNNIVVYLDSIESLLFYGGMGIPKHMSNETITRVTKLLQIANDKIQLIQRDHRCPN